MTNTNDQSTQKKSLVFFTHAPNGTLGDPSAAAKLINQLKQDYADSLDITIVLIVDAENVNKVEQVIPKNVNIFTMPFFNMLHEKINSAGKKTTLRDLVEQSDGIIFFPTFHFFKDWEVDFIAHGKKPIFITTEYNLHEKNKKIQMENRQDWMAQFNTGLGEDLGIFCTPIKEKPAAPLSQITDEADKRFVDFLLSSSTDDNRDLLAKEADYHQYHELFFGYFNALNNEHESNQVDPLLLIEACLEISPENKIIDIVLPLSTKIETSTHYKTMKEIIDYFSNDPLKMKEYTFEFYTKDEKGKIIPHAKIGQGTKVVRLINGFPFTPKTVNNLMQAANPLVLVTGDQSLSEALSLGKIFLYQTMWWKEPLFTNLLDEVKTKFSSSSPLYIFLQMQLNKSASRKDIIQYLKNHKEELLQQINELNKHLSENKNLYKVLPVKLMECMSSPKAYIQACLRNNPQPKIAYLFTLWKMYPNELLTICKEANIQPEILIKKLHEMLVFTPLEDFKEMIQCCISEDLIKDHANIFINMLEKTRELFHLLANFKEKHQCIKNLIAIQDIDVVVNGNTLKFGDLLARLDNINDKINQLTQKDAQSIKQAEHNRLLPDQSIAKTHPLFSISYDFNTKKFFLSPGKFETTDSEEINEFIKYELSKHTTRINAYLKALNLQGVEFQSLAPIYVDDETHFVFSEEQEDLLLSADLLKEHQREPIDSPRTPIVTFKHPPVRDEEKSNEHENPIEEKVHSKKSKTP